MTEDSKNNGGKKSMDSAERVEDMEFVLILDSILNSTIIYKIIIIINFVLE